MNKKILNTSFVYAILAMISGVFYREFTKFSGFIGKTALSVTHVHLFILGAFLFLVLLLLENQFKITNHKNFNKFYLTYNIGLISMVTMLYVRGIIQVKNIEITKAMNGAISGFSGVSHVILAAGIVIFYLTLKKVVIREYREGKKAL